MTERTERSVTHATFTIERTYNAPVERVFRALVEPELKRQWFAGPPEWGPEQYEPDPREGGHEVSSGGPKEGPMSRFASHIFEIVPNRRLITAYEMHLDDVRISVSLQTIQIEPAGTGTLLTFTEYGAYLDGYDDAGAREHGSRELLEAMARVIEGSEVTG